jgi:hypothetical protein
MAKGSKIHLSSETRLALQQLLIRSVAKGPILVEEDETVFIENPYQIEESLSSANDDMIV